MAWYGRTARDLRRTGRVCGLRATSAVLRDRPPAIGCCSFQHEIDCGPWSSQVSGLAPTRSSVGLSVEHHWCKTISRNVRKFDRATRRSATGVNEASGHSPVPKPTRTEHRLPERPPRVEALARRRVSGLDLV